MRTKLLTMFMAMIFLAVSNSLSAQSFEKGTSIASVGYGFGNLTVALLKSAEVSGATIKVTSIGPMFAKYEYGLTDNIGIGLNVAYVGISVNELYSNGNYFDRTDFNSISALARINIHFANSKKADPYIGFGAGISTASYKYYSNNFLSFLQQNNHSVGLGADLTIGLRYYLNDDLGVFAEVGVAKAVVQIGISTKF